MRVERRDLNQADYIKLLEQQIKTLKEQNANYEFALKLLVEELNKLKEEE